MAKKLNTVSVNMQFNTDIKQAKRQIEELQSSLTKLISSSTQVNVDSSKIREATIATAELQSHLKNATNIDTGNLDFGKLSQSLKKSGKTLQEYGDSLRNLGPQGQQAFMQLTQAVVSAEVPIRRTNALVKEFATTLANTARWQLSSSVLHGFMGALQSAYGYAQDLNESLNNIRIVTGRSVDDMANFAKEANKAAKALSTTTTKYTDASLIYYQQGLKDADVKKRADVTIKLANVSRQSAEEVSNQMTAVWNNFYDGSKSLEHYADVMTALGATTASSTEEIAGGLEKFAAVADTIGLSYEYAASALATITSNTRQSEEVVGTALKTIFARIQGLNLGETLDDGTTLNKYSEALDKVGVNIYDTNGQLKDMDTILNNLGSRWNQLGKDQQVALAQTVAGVRQYNQLIALMDNWNKGDSDSFMANLATANNSSGALNKQADIYAESWEAASDRVTAAAEAIYKSLINDEFFIDLLNNVEKLLGFINNLIEGLGGLRGVLFSLGAIITKVFSQQMSQGLTNMAYNLQMMTKQGRQKIQQEKSDFIRDAADKMAKSADTGEAGYDQKMAAKIYEQQLERQQELIDNANKMSEIEKDTAKRLMDQLKLRDELAIKSAQELQSKKDALADSASLIYTRGANLAAEKHKKYNPVLITEEMTKVKAGVSGATELQELFASGNNINEDSIVKVFKKINGDTSKGWNIVSASQVKEVRALSQGLKGLEQDTEAYRAQLNAISGVMGRVNEKIQEHASTITGATAAEIKNYAKNVNEVAKATKEKNKATEESKRINEDLKKTIKEAKGAQQSWSDTLVAGASVAMSFASALSMIGGMWDTLQNPDLSGWQKFTTILTTLGMLIPTLITTWSALQTLIKSETFEKIKNVAATIAQVIAEKKLNNEKNKGTTATKKNLKETIADTKEKLKNAGTKVKDKISGGWGKIKTSWNENALAKSKDFKQINGGGYQAQGKMAEKVGSKFLSKEAAANFAGKEALKSAGGYAAGAAVAAALVIAAIAAYKKLNNILNKNELAAKRAEKAAQNLANAYAKVSQEYDNLLNTMTNYNNAKKSLEELTKGTVEFSKAIQDANAEAMKLIENYGNIIGSDYSIDANGLIQIDDKALQEIKEQEYSNLQKEQIASSIANRQAKEARITADMTELNREKIKSREGFTNEDWTGTGKGAAIGQGIGAVAGLGAGIGMAATGATIGAAAGSVVPVVGTLIGAAAGIIVGSVTGAVVNAIDKNSETDKEKEAFKKLEEAYRTKGEMIFEDDSQIREMFPTDEFGNLADELIENKDAVKDLVKEMALNTAAIEAENRAMTNSILAENDKITSSRHGVEAVSVFAADTYGQKKEELYDKYLADASSRAIFASGNKTSKETVAKYAELTGLNELDGFKITNYKADGSFDYKYKDENGKWQKKNNVTAEEVAARLSAEELGKEVNSKGEEITTILDKLDETTVKVLAGAKSKDMSALTINELRNSGDFSKLSVDELKNLGFEGDSKDNIIEEIEAQLNKNKEDIKNYADLQSQTVGQLVEAAIDGTNKAFNNVSQNALKQYSEVLGKIEASSSKEATKKFDTGMSALLLKYQDKADAITQIANNIDWTKGDVALQDFNYQLMQMGINVDESGKGWSDLQSAISKIHLSVLNQDLDATRNSLAEISKLTKDLSLGDIISDEDYDKLIKYNAELEKYFIMTADGYKYIGSENINNIVKQSHADQLKGILDGNNNAREAAAAFKDTWWTGGEKEDWYGLANGTDADWKIATMATSLAQNSKYTQHIKTLGMSPEMLQEWSETLSDANSSTESKNNARERLQAFYQNIIDLQNKVDAGEYDDDRAHEIIASDMSLNELKNATYINQETKDKLIPYLEEAAQADKDIFRDVNKELEDIEFNLSKIEKAKENAFGPDKIDLIKQETEQLQKQVEAEQERQNLLKTKINDQKTQLTKDYSFLTFNADGSISNYNDLYENLAEDEWEAAKKAMDDYGQSLAEVRESELAILDLQNEVNSKNLEAYEAADEALSKYTEQMQHHNTVLEDYKNLLGLIGKETDYDSIGVVLEGQASVLNNILSASQANYTLYTNEVSKWAEAMNNATEGTAEFEAYKKNWEDAVEKSQEAQEQMLSDLQTWAESEKAILENTLADLGKSLEQTLTGGQTFDKINTQMERAQSLQEEYLTTTNQIYETTKMMRIAQQAIDTSSNSITKERLKNFITETKNLQEKEKLSQYELDMQQAKYDLLVAEIALEEAQNAKSTVRLQRDSEGNFGYVYTADANAVADAQQKFDDAENALYNKGLEGANNYAQKYQQTMSEMTSTLQEIQTNYLQGSYASEAEYQAAMTEARTYYTQQLQIYSDLYGIATKDNTDIINEAWSSSCNIMSTSVSEVNQAINDYMDGASNAFSRWQNVVATVKETTGEDLAAIESNVNSVTSVSDALAASLTGEGGLISELKTGFAEVAKAITTALSSWNGLTIEVNDDNSVDSNISNNENSIGGGSTRTVGHGGLGKATRVMTMAATGGLTSNWGPEGKMLMVHESELILNKGETDQFFKHLQMMETILSTLDLYAANQQLGGVLTSPTGVSAAADTLEQNVKIEASFPGVTDRNEIEEAFNNLVNKASQYANRK